jgi:hypothetical protein
MPQAAKKQNNIVRLFEDGKEVHNPGFRVIKRKEYRRRPQARKRFLLLVHLVGYQRPQRIAYAYAERAIKQATEKMVRGGDWWQLFTLREEELVAEGTRTRHKVIIQVKDIGVYDDIMKKRPWVLQEHYKYERKD